MTDLERLKAELERQDRGLAACLDRLRGLDPELVIAVSPEWMRELTGEAEPPPPPAFWAVRV